MATDFYCGTTVLAGLRSQVQANLVIIDAAAINKFPLGVDPVPDQEVFVKSGRYGPYAQSGSGIVGSPETLSPVS